MKNSFLIFIVMITGQLANASEPAYCSIANFFATEQMTSLKGVDRLRVFKVGKLTLVGAGIGNSDIKALEQFAVTNATSSRPANYCTWYLNEGNGDAETKFNHQYLPQPWNIPSIVAYQYEQILGDSFATAENNFVKCAAEENYLALGCNGMRHRGPSAFAMLLAFSGCSPEHSAAIANQAWGLNFVPPGTRLLIAKKGFELGNRQPEARKALQQVMTSN